MALLFVDVAVCPTSRLASSSSSISSNMMATLLSRVLCIASAESEPLIPDKVMLLFLNKTKYLKSPTVHQRMLINDTSHVYSAAVPATDLRTQLLTPQPTQFPLVIWLSSILSLYVLLQIINKDVHCVLRSLHTPLWPHRKWIKLVVFRRWGFQMTSSTLMVTCVSVSTAGILEDALTLSNPNAPRIAPYSWWNYTGVVAGSVQVGPI